MGYDDAHEVTDDIKEVRKALSFEDFEITVGQFDLVVSGRIIRAPDPFVKDAFDDFEPLKVQYCKEDKFYDLPAEVLFFWVPNTRNEFVSPARPMTVKEKIMDILEEEAEKSFSGISWEEF